MNYLVNRDKIVEAMKDVKVEISKVKNLFLFDYKQDLFILRETINYQEDLNPNIDFLVLLSNGEVEQIDYPTFSKYLELNPDSSTSIIKEYEKFSLFEYENNLTIVVMKDNQELSPDDTFKIKEVDDSFIFPNSLDKKVFSYE